jgi:flagellar motility protein MotE (MotC chaperone)
MDPAFSAGFLREMSSDKAGLIMANMEARKSYAISVIIAGRNAKYRKPR